VVRAEEAIELFTGMPAGEMDASGAYPKDSVYGRVMARLTRFDTMLTARHV
jgi:hypothetical protein